MESDNMGKIVDMNQYRLAKQVIKDVPEILKIIDKFGKSLYNHRNYVDVNEILMAMGDAKYMLEIHYKRSLKIVNEKGVSNNVKK